MKWPVVFIGVVLVLGVIIFAVSYGEPKNAVVSLPEPIISTSSGQFLGASTSSELQESGVRGRVQVACLTDGTDPACLPKIWTIEAYQGVSSVGLFKTTADGTFRAKLPPGQYELRVSTEETTHCVSVGIVVPENSFVSTNISCTAASLE